MELFSAVKGLIAGGFGLVFCNYFLCYCSTCRRRRISKISTIVDKNPTRDILAGTTGALMGTVNSILPTRLYQPITIAALMPAASDLSSARLLGIFIATHKKIKDWQSVP